eukprot:GEMP01036224.1.p1 GENE.GEMP01036224.1~~GEMP01036224.1.p1  ORF type:complete len:141 (+),score=29.00 GEMP01036224.1:126-548(+)
MLIAWVFACAYAAIEEQFVDEVVKLYNEQYDEVHRKAVQELKLACMNSAKEGRNEAEVNVYRHLRDGFDHDKILQRFAETAKSLGFDTVTFLDISYFWKIAGIKVSWSSETKGTFPTEISLNTSNALLECGDSCLTYNKK